MPVNFSGAPGVERSTSAASWFSGCSRLGVPAQSPPATIKASAPARSQRQGQGPKGPRAARRLDAGEHRGIIRMSSLGRGRSSGESSPRRRPRASPPRSVTGVRDAGTPRFAPVARSSSERVRFSLAPPGSAAVVARRRNQPVPRLVSRRFARHHACRRVINSVRRIDSH
jgi:hypothetical protein